MNPSALAEWIGLSATLYCLYAFVQGRRRLGRRVAPVFGLLLFVGAVRYTTVALEWTFQPEPAWLDFYGEAFGVLWPAVWFYFVYALVCQRYETSLEQRRQQLEQALEELRRLQEREVEDGRLRAFGELAAGVVHDFNNRLTVMLSNSELLLATGGLDPDQTEAATQILAATEDAAATVARLREFYRASDELRPMEELELAPLLAECERLTRPKWESLAQATGAQIHFHTTVDGSPRIVGDRLDLLGALTNLVFNAVDALPRGGNITLRARGRDLYTVIEVIDDGVGMDEATRRRCLTPFFSTKGRSGTGLGLPLAQSFAERHGGRLEIESAPGGGTVARFVLPREFLARRMAPEPRELVAPEGLEVLLVDDNEHVRDVVAQTLISLGHRVTEADGARHGCERLLEGPVDVVILDRSMPDGSGDEVALQMKRLSPGVPIVMLTGFGDLMGAVGDQPPAVDAVIGKPASRATLQRTLAQVCDGQVRSSA